MFIRPVDVSCWEQVLKCPDDGGETVVTGDKMLKGGDERPLWLWCFVSFSSPRCKFFTS